VQALGLCFAISTLGLALALAWQRQFPSGLALGSALVVLPALAGMAWGQRVRGRFSAGSFRRWFLLTLLLMGLYSAFRALAKLSS
jgi:uncharacterized membrane protein YfcA